MELLKNYLSAGRFAKGKLCGRLGHWLSQGNKQFAHTGFNRGNIIHALIQSIYNPDIRNKEKIEEQTAVDEKVYMDALADIIPDITEVDEIEKEVNKEIIVNDFKLRCTGYVDLCGQDTVYEIKTGDAKEWHIYQVLYYKWALNKEKAILIYPDLCTTKDATKEAVVTSTTIATTWENIVRGEPNECSICPECPIRKDCPIWQGESNKDTLRLSEVIARKKDLEVQVKTQKEILKRYVEPYVKELDSLKQEEVKLRNKIAQSAPPMTKFKIPGGTITVTKGQETLELPPDFKPPSYKQDPSVYKHVIDTQLLKKKYGKPQKKNSIRVKLDRE